MKENNPKQRNLLVQNVNNNKKLPLLITEFVKSGRVESNEYFEHFQHAFLQNLIENQQKILSNETFVSNLALILYYWIEQSSSVKEFNGLVSEIIALIVKQLKEHF